MPFARARDLKGFAAGGERDDFGDEDKPAAADEYDDGLPEPYGSRWRALPLSLHADHEELLPNSVLMHQAVWKSTAGLWGPHQTSNLPISVTSKSIRLIFGPIDCSSRVLEAERKCSRQNLRIRAH